MGPGRRATARLGQPRRSRLHGFLLSAFLAVAVPVLVSHEGSVRAEEREYAKPISNRLNTTGKELTISLPLKDGTSELGEVAVRIRPDDSLLVSKADLAARLDRVLQPKSRARLAGVSDERGFVALPAMRASGIPIRFDAALQELHLDLAADHRQTSEISVSRRSPAPVSAALSKPAIVSGYLNIIAGVDHLWEGVGSRGGVASGPGDGRTSGRLELDSALRLRETVLENRFVYEGEVDANTCPSGARCLYEHAPGLKRQGSRIVYDQPEKLLRLQIGDTSAAGLPIQRSVETLGVALEKSPRKLAPGEQSAVSARTSLRIDRPSDVDVVVNGAILQRLRLRSGVYNIRDLPLATGANEVTLIVTDDTGARRSERFTTFAATNQLAAGDVEWSVSGGVPSYLRDNERNYDMAGNYIGTGLLRYGLNDAITSEVHLQSDVDTTMGGGGVIAQTPWGVFGLHGAASIGRFGSGIGADASWDLINFSGVIAERRESLRLAAEYRSQDFHRPGEFLTTATGILYPEFNYWLRLSGSYSVALNWSVHASVSARYQFFDPDQLSISPFTIKGDRYGVDLTLSRPLGRLMNASVLLGYSNESYLRYASEFQDSEKPDFRVAMRVNARFDDNTTIAASYDSLDRHAALSAYRSQGHGIGRWDTTLDVQHFGYIDTATATGSLGYYGNRGEVRVSHNSDVRNAGLDDTGLQPGLQRTSVRVGSSLAFADGVVAVGAPIRGGAYAIVHPHDSIKDKEIIVGDADRTRAIANAWGPAVVTDLPAYASSSIGVDVENLPVGYSLGAGAFDMKAPYKAGYALKVGSANSVTAHGTLLSQSGEPAASAIGTATAGDGSDSRVSFFTSASGRFAVEGLAPGRWILDVSMDGSAARYTIDIPAGTQGLFKVGNLQPSGGSRP